MDFKTLEDVGTFMLINIRLSRYDLQFVNNLTNMIGVKNTVTTNQDNLFKKIALKYRRQFIQHKCDIDTLLTAAAVNSLAVFIPTDRDVASTNNSGVWTHAP